MSQQDDPNELPTYCDAACKAKILLNAGRVANESNMISNMVNNGIVKLSEAEGKELIAILDVAEEKLIKFNERMLKRAGYKGKGLQV